MSTCLIKMSTSGWTMSKLFVFFPCKILSHLTSAKRSFETTLCTSIWCKKLNCNKAMETTTEVLSLSTTPSMSRRNLCARGFVKDFWTDKDSNLNSFLHSSMTSTVTSDTLKMSRTNVSQLKFILCQIHNFMKILKYKTK